MPDIQQIVVEFVTDTTGLQPAAQQLEKIGAIEKGVAAEFKKANAEIVKQQSVASTTGKAVDNALKGNKKSIDDLDKEMQTFVNDFIAGFNDGVLETLKEAGISAEDFAAAIKSGGTEITKSTNTVKQRLTEIATQLAILKSEGKDNTEQYKALTKEAGNLKDALGDVNQEIKNASANSQALDGLLSVASGAAAGFAIAQGGIGLFGDESEALNEVLLKVNSTIAILSGLQQVQNTLQSESAAMKLIDVARTKAQIAAQTIYNLVVGESIGVLKAFRLAIAGTGIGLLILALIAAIQYLKDFAVSAEAAAEEQKKLNDAIATTNESLVKSNELYVQSISDRKKDLENQLALAEARGDAEIKLLAIRKQISLEEGDIAKKSLDNLSLTRNKVFELSNQYQNVLGKLVTLNSVAQGDLSKRNQEAAETLRGRLQAQADAIKPLLDAGLAALEKLDESNQLLAELEIKRQKAIREARNLALQDQLAGLEVQLLRAQRNQTATLAIEQAIVRKKAEIDLNQEKLTAKQRLRIQEQAFTDQINLSKENAKKISDQALNDLISRNNAELSNINITTKERLRLTAENITNTAQLEINAAESNASKIKEIIARREADIKAIKLQAIQEAADYEIAITTAKNGAVNRLNLRIVADEKRTQRERLRALNESTQSELDNNNIRLDALNESLRKGLISQKDYNLQYAQLQDEQTKITEDAEQKRLDIIAQSKKKREEQLKEDIDLTIQIANAALDIYSQINDNRKAKEDQRISEERERIRELRESGAITEKEELARNRRLDQDEKRIKYQQAQRDKQVALFQAIINTAAGVAKAIPNLFLMGLAAAVGGAQIALIASRPIPKFGKGKRNQYEGPAEVGETGAELVQQGNRMFVAKKSTFVWLGKNDKVYNPQETAAMISSHDMQPASASGTLTNHTYNTNVKIDYERLGKSVGRNIPKVGITIDGKGFTTYIDGEKQFGDYLKNRRGYKL